MQLNEDERGWLLHWLRGMTDIDFSTYTPETLAADVIDYLVHNKEDYHDRFLLLLIEGDEVAKAELLRQCQAFLEHEKEKDQE